MDAAKIHLSAKEIRLAGNTRIILTKNRIMDKTRSLLGHLQSEYRESLVQSELPPELVKSSPKISRGENYKGLPWLVLDYPRRFGVENIFAIRTMFWWGNFFSVTLHLSGEFKEQVEDKLIASFKKLRKEGFSICMNENQWEHHFEKGNYTSLDKIKSKEFEEIIRNKPFIKIAYRLSIGKWDKAKKLLMKHFDLLLRSVS